MEGEDIQRHRIRQRTDKLVRCLYIGTLLAQSFIFQSSWFDVIGRVMVFAADIVLPSTLQQLQAGNNLRFCLLPTQMYVPAAKQHSTLTQTLFPQVMHEYFVCLLRSFTNCTGGGQFFPPRRHDSREDNIRS